jgi:hypothetical protein
MLESLNLVKQLFGKKGVLLHPIVQAICFKKPVESLNSCQTIVRQSRSFSPSYCTGNLLQKVCGKFEFLSNNCLAKKVCFSILLYRHCTDNMLQKACGNFEFLSNNCSAKKAYFTIFLYRHVRQKFRLTFDRQ